MSLSGKIALVTGASRGLGKGIAIELGRLGSTVYVTGRSPQSALNFPNTSTLKEVADEITSVGGKGIPVYCDHENPEEVKRLFQQISNDQNGRLDIHVNNAYKAVQYIGKNVGKKFYEYDGEPEFAWDVVNNTGLRNHYICSVYAARLMVPRKQGLIVTLSSPGAMGFLFNIPYGVGKAACDKMASDVANDLAEYGIISVSLWPGAVKTEIVEQTVLSGRGKTDASLFANAESIYFAGKCIAKLAVDPDAIKQTGKTLLTTELASLYDIKDVDGTVPKHSSEPIFRRYLDALNAFRTHGIKSSI